MIDANSEAINSGLRSRQLKIGQAQDHLARTRELFDRFGSAELKASHARFDELARSLESDRNVKLVVVGEFSRGKSSLVNALMGIELLRYAKQATTAVNTFIRALPPGRTERFITIHFLDGRAPQDLAWTDAATLERWSTELDESHAEARRQVAQIEIFMSHPLLEQGLVLIDTPGLQSLVEHHESITRGAIAEAHIALWVQSALQLGGNATEWAFLSDTIRRNFSKFITVVNMWDEILESTDRQDAGKSEAQRSADGLAEVRENFHKFLGGQAQADLDLMTNPDHLMGVSALWAMSDDAAQRARSGVPRLASAIRDLFQSGEALEQVYRKPLKQMLHIQEQLAGSIGDELKQLASNDSQAERQRDLDLIDQEIRNLDLEMRNADNESQQEHRNAARHMAAQMEKRLTQPLANLRAEIEDGLTSEYIATRIARKDRKIGLPDQLAQRFSTVWSDIELAWRSQKDDIGDSLEGLRSTYAERMARHGGHLNDVLRSLDISLPAPQIGFDLDLSRLEDYHAAAADLEQQIAEREEECEQLQVELEMHRADPGTLKAAQDSLSRARRRIDELGPQPAPQRSSRREKVASGGMWSSDRFEDVPCYDNSNVEAWRENMKREEAALMQREDQLQAIVDEEQRKTKVKISTEAAIRKYDKMVQTFRRKQAQAEQQYAQAQRDVVADTLARLRHATAGQLEQRIGYIRERVAESILDLYESQLQLLAGCVQEQYVEPLNAKRAQRDSVRQLIEQGQEHVESRKAQLAQGQAQIDELIGLTRAAGAH